MTLSRRDLLTLAAGLPLRGDARMRGALPEDVLAQAREDLRETFAGRNLALELRALVEEGDELFRIQINAERLLPVASCFKAFVVPWYYLSVPRREWDDGPESALWSMAVHSGNIQTAESIAAVAQHVPGEGNAIEKFNDFLASIGMQNGLFAWGMGPTSGLLDLRYRPSPESGRVVQLDGRSYWIFNVCTANDLARGHEFITRGERLWPGAGVAQALRHTRALLGRPEAEHLSPIERVFAPGYVGKHGSILPSDIPVGHVYNDAGLLKLGRRRYLVAFMSMAEPERQALSALREVVWQIGLVEQALERQSTPLMRLPRARG